MKGAVKAVVPGILDTSTTGAVRLGNTLLTGAILKSQHNHTLVCFMKSESLY